MVKKLDKIKEIKFNFSFVKTKQFYSKSLLLHNASWSLKERLPTASVSGGWRNFRPSNSDVP